MAWGLQGDNGGGSNLPRAIIWPAQNNVLLEAEPVITFIVVACLMSLAALAFVLVPLLRSRTNANGVESARLSDTVSNVAVFRSQKREIEEEFARGSIGAEERDAALNELSQRLVDEVPGNAAAEITTPISRGDRRPWLLMGALGALIPVGAFMMYATIGSPQALRAGGPVAAANAGEISPHAGMGAAPGADAAVSDQQIIAMVDTLAQKMQQNPGDPKGWVLLARSQGALGRYPEAAVAYERAAQLLPTDAQLFADYADAVAMQQQGRFEGKPMALIQKALKLDPNNTKGLALAGTAELRLGNREASLKYWKKLKTLVAKDTDDERQVDAIIAEVQSGKGPIEASAVTAEASPARPNMKAPAPAMPAAVAAPAASAGATISGQVILTSEMAAKLTPTDTLFVFARAKEGPRMPLAILRTPAPKAGDFPKSFELTDAMAMAPGMSLSSFPEIVIEARISRSGSAPLQPGDLTGVSEAIKPGARAVKVTISRAAP